MELSSEQRAAVEILRHNQLCLFSGPPGSGKTTTLAHWLKSFGGQEPMSYLAPTGKAAQRMSEAFAEVQLKADGQTIHSALHPRSGGRDGGGWKFRYGIKEPLPVSRIIVDECSMIDLSLMRAVMDATGKNTQLVLTGDPNQLPPVSSGRPFLDMINSGRVPHAKLSKIHRNAGRGAQVCQEIMRGEAPTFSQELDLDLDAGPYGPENIVHVERCDPERAIRSMIGCFDKITDRGIYNPFNDVQVICFTNKSREILNLALQEHLNPEGQRIPDVPFRLDDKVMCLKNKVRRLARIGPKGPDLRHYRNRLQYVANGETGRVTYLDEEKELVLVLFPKSSAHVRYTLAAAKKELTLAYAITCHKSQGGGWPVVIYMIDKSIKCDRSLIYTAISRFGKICITIGQKAVVNRQVRDTNIRHRVTLLEDRLRGNIRGGLDYMEVDNVTQIASESQDREFRFNDRPQDKPECIPDALLGEASVNTDGETGTLVVKSWLGFKKLQFVEASGVDEQGGFPRL